MGSFFSFSKELNVFPSVFLMDVLDLAFPNDSFDAVIDKSTIDCILCYEVHSFCWIPLLTYINCFVFVFWLTEWNNLYSRNGN